MLENEEGNQFVGFTVIFALTAVLLFGIRAAASDPTVVTSVTHINAWAGANIQVLMWVAIIIVMATGITIPLVSMLRGGDGLEKTGAITSTIAIGLMVGYGITVLIPAITFLLGIGWFGAKHMLGQ